MRTYEAVFILDSRKLEDSGEGFCQRVKEHVESLGGAIGKTMNLGRKQFARPLGRHKSGTYLDFIVTLDPEKVADFHDRYRLDSLVLRQEVFNYEPHA